MAYGLSHRLRFYDYWGDLVDVQILKKDYTGSSTNLTGTGSSVLLHLESEGTCNEPGIKGVVVSINLRATATADFNEYFTCNNREYRVDVYTGSTLIVGGLYVDPENSSKPILQLFEANIKASTGIGRLRDIEFKQSDGNLYRDRKSLYSCLYTCLLHIDSAPKIYDAANIWATGTDYNASPFTQEYLNPVIFKQKWNEASDCYTVINEILKIKNAKMFKYLDGWCIIPVDYKGETIDLKVLEGSTGTQSTTLSNVQLHKSITNGTVAKSSLNVPINKSARITSDRAWGKGTVVQNMGYRGSIYDPWYDTDFDYSSTNGTKFSYSYDQESRDLLIKNLDSPTEFGSEWIQYSFGNVEKSVNQTLSVKISLRDVNVETRVRIFIRQGNVVMWLSRSGGWQSIPTYIGITNEPATYTVISKPLNADGEMFIEFAIRDDSDYDYFEEVYNPKQTRINVNDIDIKFNKVGGFTKNVESYVRGNDQNLYQDKIEVMMGDLADDPTNPDAVFNGLINTYSAGSYEKVYSFYSDDNTGGQISFCLAQKRMAIHSRPRRKLTGQYLAHFSMLSMPKYQNIIYVMNTFEYDMRSNVWNINGYEIFDNTERELLLETGLDLQLETEEAILLE